MALFTQKDETLKTTTESTPSVSRSQVTTADTASKTVFGATLIVEGTIKSKESITVNGELKGTIETTADITIGKEAKIEATLTGKTIAIAGTVTGNITANESLVLESSAVVRGDVKAASVKIETGALIEGNMHIGKGSQPQAPVTEKATN